LGVLRKPGQADLPAGFGAFRDGQLVSMIGLQARRFHFGRSTVLAASGHSFISGKAGRGAGFRLAKMALSDERYAAVYTLNNNALASRFYKRMGLQPWLGPRARKTMEWPVHSVTFAAGRALSLFARTENGYSSLAAREWFRSGPRALDRGIRNEPEIVRLDPTRPDHADLIERFDRALHASHYIAPLRSADVYAYQMKDPDAPNRSALFGFIEDDRLVGLMQAVMTKPNSFEPAELQIIDLAHLPDRDGARIIPPLIRTARRLAYQHRLSRIRLHLSDRFEPVCFHGTGFRYERTLGYDAAHASFAKGMEQLQARWVPTGFEGDFFFALRTIPERRKRPHKSALLEPARGGSAFTERRRPVSW
ncbi:MAG: hypothetical protein RLN72_10080, partial [Henriciella sp.]